MRRKKELSAQRLSKRWGRRFDMTYDIVTRVKMTLKQSVNQDREDGTGFESLVQKKLVLLRKHLSLTEALKECLDAKETEDLGALLARRQTCMEEVDKTDALLRKGPSERVSRGSMDHALVQMRAILSRIESLDQELTRRMREETDTLKGDLLKMRTSRNATEKYRGHAGQVPRFLDVNR